MEQFIHFVINHWALWLAFVVIAGLIILTELQTKFQGIAALTSQAVTLLINHEQAVVIDIRDESSYAKGHILTAINFPLKDFVSNLSKLESYKSKPIVVVDGLGQQASQAAVTLQKNGFTNVTTLRGGMAQWQRESLPIVK